jgi:hypothetical protein
LESNKILGKRSPVSKPVSLHEDEVLRGLQTKRCRPELVNHLGTRDADSQYFSPEEAREMAESARKAEIFFESQPEF